MKKLTEEQKKERNKKVKMLVEQGLTSAEISTKLGFCLGYTQQLIKALGLKAKKDPKPKPNISRWLYGNTTIMVQQNMYSHKLEYIKKALRVGQKVTYGIKKCTVVSKHPRFVILDTGLYQITAFYDELEEFKKIKL